jgi:hypothetical protein
MPASTGALNENFRIELLRPDRAPKQASANECVSEISRNETV